MDEVAIISRLKEIFDGEEDPDLIVGIGDDAALVATYGNGVALATDILVEGTHFTREWSDLYSIGRKAAVANIADIYAMGIPAKYLLVAVAFEPEQDESILEVARGIADECKKVGARVIGGDLARSSHLTLAITAYGEYSATNARIVPRSGAQVGDGLYLVDLPGRSSLGLEQLKRGVFDDQESIAFHRSPTVKYEDYLSVASFASSLTDLSDGIMIDAASLARSSGASIDIESERVRAHPHFSSRAAVAERLGLDPLRVVLSSGEEHSPLFTARTGQEVDPRFHRIGTVVARVGSEIMLDGRETKPEGFQHF